jgi:hypothetical protein
VAAGEETYAWANGLSVDEGFGHKSETGVNEVGEPKAKPLSWLVWALPDSRGTRAERPRLCSGTFNVLRTGTARRRPFLSPAVSMCQALGALCSTWPAGNKHVFCSALLPSPLFPTLQCSEVACSPANSKPVSCSMLCTSGYTEACLHGYAGLGCAQH